jgi:putative PIN family toxin of toxin-antitoxin system
MSRPPGRPRAVFDCNTFIQALAFEDGPAGRAFQLMEGGAFELFVSKLILAELRRVLGYEEVLAISPNLTPDRIEAFLERLTFRANLRRRVRHTFDYARDPDDEPYLDLALAIRADYLVTRDKDLLSLMTGHTLFCKQFRRATHPLRVLSATDFLGSLGQSWKPRQEK